MSRWLDLVIASCSLNDLQQSDKLSMHQKNQTVHLDSDGGNEWRLCCEVKIIWHHQDSIGLYSDFIIRWANTIFSIEKNKKKYEEMFFYKNKFTVQLLNAINRLVLENRKWVTSLEKL